MKNLLAAVLLSAAGLGIGLVLIRAPGFCIELQRKFYAFLNWRIEPISMKRELRSTRLLGFFLAILCACGLVFALFLP